LGKITKELLFRTEVIFMKKTIKVILGMVAALMTAVTGVLLYCYNLAFRRDEKRVSKEGAVPEGEQYEVFSDVIIKGAEAAEKSYPTFFEDYVKLGGKADVIDLEQ
jgi:hypothetical protein